MQLGLEKILAGRGEPADLGYLEELGTTIKAMSRCGLGQTSPNPVLTTLQNFRSEYENRVKPNPDGMNGTFDVRKAVCGAEAIAGHPSVHFGKSS